MRISIPRGALWLAGGPAAGLLLVLPALIGVGPAPAAEAAQAPTATKTATPDPCLGGAAPRASVVAGTRTPTPTATPDPCLPTPTPTRTPPFGQVTFTPTRAPGSQTATPTRTPTTKTSTATAGPATATAAPFAAGSEPGGGRLLGKGSYTATRPKSLQRGESGNVKLEVRVSAAYVGQPIVVRSAGFEAELRDAERLEVPSADVFDDMTATLSLPNFTVKPAERATLTVANSFASAAWSIAPNSSAEGVQLGRLSVTRADGTKICEFEIDVRVTKPTKGLFGTAIDGVTNVKALFGGITAIAASVAGAWALIRRFRPKAPPPSEPEPGPPEPF